MEPDSEFLYRISRDIKVRYCIRKWTIWKIIAYALMIACAVMFIQLSFKLNCNCK